MENIVRDGGDATTDVTSNEAPEDPATTSVQQHPPAHASRRAVEERLSSRAS